MGEQREDVEALGAVLEQEAQFQVSATLEGRGAKLAGAKTGVQMGLAETYVVLGIVGIGDDASTLERLVEALEDMSRRFYGQREPLSVTLSNFFEKPKSVLSPRDAWYAPKRVVPLNDSVGEVSGESVMIYPPGIPLVIPGERITEATLEHYRFYLQNHCTVLSDEDEEGMITILGE